MMGAAGRKDNIVTQFPGGRVNHINPVLNVRDLSVSIDFYTRMLRLELYHTFGEPADFAIVGRDGQQIYLCQQAQGQPGTWLAVFLSDPTAMFDHLSTNGARLVAPYNTDAGEFRVEDPDGHVLRFLR
jgi:catechol 2,3-dioxygenase-like lactoylglutathione lyase family enzyme